MNNQAKKLIHGYLSWLLKHEQGIRNQVDFDVSYTSGNVVLNYTYGLCANIAEFIINRDGSLSYSFQFLNEKWPYFSGNHHYPVPMRLGCRGRDMAKSVYEVASPKSTWCSGTYADARWAYIRFLHEELSKCP